MILPRLNKPRYREFGTTTFPDKLSLSTSLLRKTTASR